MYDESCVSYMCPILCVLVCVFCACIECVLCLVCLGCNILPSSTKICPSLSFRSVSKNLSHFTFYQSLSLKIGSTKSPATSIYRRRQPDTSALLPPLVLGERSRHHVGQSRFLPKLSFIIRFRFLKLKSQLV